MMYSALFLAATAAFASAQITYDNTTGKIICPADHPNGVFCGGKSLETNFIVQCQDGVGIPGNCDSNLSGFFPTSSGGAKCWQEDPTCGIAACAKNCVVRGSSGNYPGDFTLPNCTPVPEPSSSSTSSMPSMTPTPDPGTESCPPVSSPTPGPGNDTPGNGPPCTGASCNGPPGGDTPGNGPPCTGASCNGQPGNGQPGNGPPCTGASCNGQPGNGPPASGPSGYPVPNVNGSTPTAPGGYMPAPSTPPNGPPIIVASGAMTNSGLTGAGLAAAVLLVAYFL